MQDYVDNGAGILVPANPLLVGGVFHIEHIRDGKVIDEFDVKNLVVNEGLNHMLGVVLHGDGAAAAWYLGLFEGNYTPVNTDTAATIAASSTETTAITASQRPTWTPAAASAQSITNSASRATVTFNATKTIYGAFLISNNVIGGSTGVLFAAARFGTAKPVVNLDQLLLTYTFAASSV